MTALLWPSRLFRRFSPRESRRMEGKSTWELSASCGVRKGIIRLNLAEWRLKNTFSFVFFTVFILFLFIVCRLAKTKKNKYLHLMVSTGSDYIQVWWSPSESQLFQVLQINFTVIVLAVGLHRLNKENWAREKSIHKIFTKIRRKTLKWMENQEERKCICGHR